MGREAYLDKIAFVGSTAPLQPHTANMSAGPVSLHTYTVGHRV